MRLLVLLVVLLILSLPLTGAALAQAPEPRISTQPSCGPPQPDAVPTGDEAEPFARWQPAADVLTDAAGPAVTIGQPGLSFRYVQTFGETLVPYLADNSHLFRPWGVTADASGNVYVTEGDGHRMMKFTANGDFLMSIGQAGVWLANNTNRMSVPRGVAVDGSGNIWIAESGSTRVSRWDTAGKYVSQLGQTWNQGSDNSRFRNPSGIVFDSAGRVYIGDDNNHRVQVFDGTGSYVATLGTGSCGAANSQFCSPQGLAVDSAGRLYVADRANHRVQIFDANRAYLATLGTTGACGQGNNQFCQPFGVAIGPDGKVYVSDPGNRRVQIFAPYPALSYVATLGVTGQWGSDNAHLGWPIGVAVDASGNIYVVDEDNSRVQKFDSSHNYVRTFGVTGVPYLTDNLHFMNPSDAAIDSAGNLIVLEETGQRFVKLDANGVPLFAVGNPGNPDWGTSGVCWPNAIATDGVGHIYLANTCNNRIQVYDKDGAYLATVGTGYGTGNVQFNRPQGIVVGSNGYLYVADTDNHRIQVFDSSYNYVSTIGQTGVAGTDNAHFNRPMRPALDQAGNIYIADSGNLRVQKCTLFGACTTFAGTTGASGSDFDHFSEPDGVAVDKQGRVYVVDQHNGRVQVHDQNGTYLTTLGGSRGTSNGQNQNPMGVEVDTAGNVYIVDRGNHRIQKFAPGVPGWRQVNINGFGEQRAGWISTLLPFQGSLYAAGYPKAYVRRMLPDGVWSRVNADGFGDPTNQEVDAMAEFNGQLYAATYTWVCDNPNCSTGHTNGPQIWRSPNGTTWQNVTPVAGFGAGSIYIDTFAVFDGQLYAAVYAGAARGAEIWRTADGTGWTRVAANGFDDDLYNTDVLTLAVYNGQLYAGTRHGDWYNDGHADGPLGGEVWRSADGEHWSQANNPGFGLPEAHRVERLLLFKDALYAYVSHTGGSAWGADVWRCATAICAAQGDWAKVADNGFGVPQNQYLYSGVTAGDYLYAAAQNDITGVQLWRTADGSHWEKATPYDGLGDSNSTYVYFAAMTVHEGKLFIGPTNWANGAEVWMKTLTADFIATPTRGAPPLTVAFANASSGDFTTSQWDFGDGGTSTAISPTHMYMAAGTYTVTLTVGDGTDTSTLSKAAYIDVHQRVFLPVVMKNYDPLRYDDFNDPTYDGVWNPLLWRSTGESWFHAEQHNGAMVLWNDIPATGGGARLDTRPLRSLVRSPQRPWFVEARLRMSSDRIGGHSSVQVKGHTSVNGHWWTSLCSLGGDQDSSQAYFECAIIVSQGNNWPTEYHTQSLPVAYDAWHTARIEIVPGTAELRFYLNGNLIGSHLPNDAAALKDATDMSVTLDVWNGDTNATSTRYVDDVRITPAQ